MIVFANLVNEIKSFFLKTQMLIYTIYKVLLQKRHYHNSTINRDHEGSGFEVLKSHREINQIFTLRQQGSID